ncbi:Maf family protein [Sporosarcina sp. GW1-11]|uniref:Maf family protein n=1 Tax=Sporosarcina sp. GW1-11 TaxID=2899126 RepID=UPI00294BE4AC|nr:Maf family protein [Sporosarcina sp. GW1-11]MDV6377223.1 Maf family protein [Sporosarcina sp. GW1-11]
MKFSSIQPIILASNSPRRKELLQLAGIEFTVKPSRVKEDLPFTPHEPDRYAVRLSEQKAQAVFDENPTAMVIAADTIVVKDDRQYPKPVNNEQAVEFLLQLSGETHQVITGVTVLLEDRKLQFASLSQVKFRDLDIGLVHEYVRSGDAADKAGAYGIQTEGMLFVEAIVGDYQNIVGLPIGELVEHLRREQWLMLEVGDA